MNDKNMTLLNQIMYYVIAPLIVLEFVFIDFGYLSFFGIIHGITILVFVILIVINSIYKKDHPKFEYKVNDLYTKVMFIVIMLEFLFINGMS